MTGTLVTVVQELELATLVLVWRLKGMLSTYLSVRSEVKFNPAKDQITRLHQVKGSHPMALTTDKETRDLMKSLIACGIYTIQPAAQLAMETALAEVASLACPIMPITPFESVAYADEEEALTCAHDTTHLTDGEGKEWPVGFTKGKSYPLRTATYKWTHSFKRTKPHLDEETNTTYNVVHDCTQTGQDRYIQFTDDTGQARRFMDRPGNPGADFDEALLWKVFDMPLVKTIFEAKPEAMAANASVLKCMAMMSGFTYYPGQAKFLERLAAKDSGLCAGDVGCHAKGAEILMADGTVKKVEDVEAGDVLQGWLSPQQVLELKRGNGPMARIAPVKGEPFVVNTDHILTLIQTNTHWSRSTFKTNGDVIDVSVKDYLQWTPAKSSARARAGG